MIGLRTPVGEKGGVRAREVGENPVIGVIATKNFEHVDFVRSTIERGSQANPGALWVRTETDSVAGKVFDDLDLPYVSLPLNPHWKGEGYDLRRTMRDVEMLRCDHLLVFQNPGATGQWKDRLDSGLHDCLRVVEHGDPKKRAKRGRKVEA